MYCAGCILSVLYAELITCIMVAGISTAAVIIHYERIGEDHMDMIMDDGIGMNICIHGFIV